MELFGLVLLIVHPLVCQITILVGKCTPKTLYPLVLYFLFPIELHLILHVALLKTQETFPVDSVLDQTRQCLQMILIVLLSFAAKASAAS
jgi:hypothetical protein